MVALQENSSAPVRLQGIHHLSTHVSGSWIRPLDPGSAHWPQWPAPSLRWPGDVRDGNRGTCGLYGFRLPHHRWGCEGLHGQRSAV